MNALSMLVLVSALLLAGCALPRPTAPPDALACDLKAFEVTDVLSDLGVYRAKQLRTLGLGDPKPSINMLALSAGGEFGAYGAGFMSGWSAAGTSAVPSPRSDIQIVTGVSTGAILATHLFLGKDAEIERLYRSLSGPQIYQNRLAIELLWANSLLDTAGKDRLIERNLRSELIDAVAQSEEGRFLYIGLVDLDSGRFLRIDMAKLAREIKPKARRDACFGAVIGASSAIPIAFAPKFIDDRMLVDGGARRHLFITALPDMALEDDVQRRLFMFVHGDMDVACTTTPNGLLGIAGRTMELVTDQGFKDSIWLTDVLAAKPARKDSTAPLFKTYYAAAAEAARVCEPTRRGCESSGGTLSEDMFCTAFMNCLADRGKADGQSYAGGAKPWLTLQDLKPARPTDCRSDAAARSFAR
jgi:predicted acylesterase/phospholipase RssA